MTIPANALFVDGGDPVTGDHLNTFVQSVTTFAEARSFIADTGMQILVQGKASPGDGYQGVFYWKSGASFVDDDMNTLVPTGASSGAWLRLTSKNLGAPFVATLNYTAGDSATLIEAILGTAASPIVSPDAVGIFQKHADASAQVANYGVYSAIFKEAGAGANARVIAGFFEAQDNIGGGFVEGIRAHGVLNTTTGASAGKAYGGIFVAGDAALSPHVSLIACEAEIDNFTRAATDTFDPGFIACCFLASVGVSTKVNDAAFMTNPFNPAAGAFNTGFFVTKGTAQGIVTSGFRMDEDRCLWGIDMSRATGLYGALYVGNNVMALRAKNFAASAQLGLIATDASDNLQIGPDSLINNIVIGNAGTTSLTVGTGMIAANGSVATALSSVGPVGSHTTVQEWLKIKNPSGTIRWLPCF